MTNEKSALLALHTSILSMARWNFSGMFNNPTDPQNPAHENAPIKVVPIRRESGPTRDQRRRHGLA
jgi:hypothetical protein